MKLKCKRPTCLHEWDYKGKNTFYACCPRCKSSIRLPRDDDEDEKQKQKV